MARQQFKVNRKAYNEIAKQAIDTIGVPMMQKVADACNAELAGRGKPEGYMVSVEGDDPLDKRDYRATVITATADAIRHDRKHDSLLRNFGVVG